jgi:hypothetical protein
MTTTRSALPWPDNALAESVVSGGDCAGSVSQEFWGIGLVGGILGAPWVTPSDRASSR